jgi:hypothetical protein
LWSLSDDHYRFFLDLARDTALRRFSHLQLSAPGCERIFTLPQQSFCTVLTPLAILLRKGETYEKRHHNLSDPLDRKIMDRLMQEFNNPGQLALGFFQETLSDTNPQAELLFKPRLPGRRRFWERKLSQVGERPLAFHLPMKPIIPPMWKSVLPMHSMMRKLKTFESGIRS